MPRRRYCALGANSTDVSPQEGGEGGAAGVGAPMELVVAH